MQATKGENMPALVPELVDMASTPAVSTADLLRRALVVARRLAVPELVDWINSELTGYKSGEVPEYRRLRGQLVAENPYHGAIPFFAPPEMAEMLADFSVRQSIPELARLQDSETGIFSHFPADIEQTLMRMMREGSGVAMRPALKFSTVQIEGLIETVRSRILDWALDLEGRGIIGEGMSFTPQEKQAVQEQHYHFGNVSGSQIQISSNGSTQTQANTTGTDLEALRGLVEALGVALDRGTVQGDAADELRAELATLKAQAASPKPKWEIIKATARTIKTVAEGAAGNILGELAKPHVQTLLALAAGTAGG
ncbi:AbiTii domain-containing protein [Sphaerotilus natans]|uniref:AbiTii domain-containing protein n=1 Tax=Sphaerotilus natans TaxID=34103 RepID=UPI00406CC929